MTLTIQLSSDAESRILEKAQRAGVDVQTYVQRLLQAEATRPPLAEVLRPVHDAFDASGLSEKELGELIVQAKKRVHAERRNAENP